MEGEEIITLAFFVLTQYGRVTDRRIYRRTDMFVLAAIHCYVLLLDSNLS